MSYDNYSVVDCDGHIVASIPELSEFMKVLQALKVWSHDRGLSEWAYSKEKLLS